MPGLGNNTTNKIENDHALHESKYEMNHKSSSSEMLKF